MATTKAAYAAAAQLTVTLNSLANGSARQSAVLDNTSNLYLDILVGGGFETASGSLGTAPGLSIWAAALTDGTDYGGTNGTNVLGGGDATFTVPANTGNLRLLAFVPINAAGATEYMQPVSVAAAFGGTLPPKFVVVVQNSTGLALNSSAGGTIFYTGINTTTA
jgi:hypothetical protein